MIAAKFSIREKPGQKLITAVTGNTGTVEMTNPNVKRRKMFGDTEQKQP